VSADVLRLLLVCGAFWLALLLHDRREPRRTPRFAASLLLGAALARLGCLWVFGGSSSTLDPQGGFSLLFLPLGPLALAPGGAAFASLPLPMALARLGCLAAGCCRGRDGEALPLIESASFGALHLALCVAQIRRVPALFLIAFGGLRIAEHPWRPTPAADAVAPEVIAGLHVLVGVLWLPAAGRSPVDQALPRTMPHSVSASRTSARTGASHR
jgi:hypothetical protein